MIDGLADPARTTETRLTLAEDPSRAREHADAIVALLEAPQPAVRESAAMRSPTSAWDRRRRSPGSSPTAFAGSRRPGDQEIAVRTVARAERLAAVAPLPADIETIVADLLRFFPSPTLDYYWPQTWVRAARLSA